MPYYDSAGLAERVRALRARRGLTLQEVAEMIPNERTGKPISRQSVSGAENNLDTSYDGMRLRILEALGGGSFDGPFYKSTRRSKT